METKKRTQILLTEPLYRALMQVKQDTGLSLSDIIRRAVELWLAQYKKGSSS